MTSTEYDKSHKSDTWEGLRSNRDILQRNPEEEQQRIKRE